LFDFEGQGHLGLKVKLRSCPKNVVCKIEDNLFINNKVIALEANFHLQVKFSLAHLKGFVQRVVKSKCEGSSKT
jgi:hypothetical protein